MRSEDLLFERERLGVRTLTIVRGLFMLVVMVTVWVVGASFFEKVATTAVAALVLLAIGVSLVLLARRRAVGRVGLFGCLIDLAVLSTLPVIWYLSVGGSMVPPTFMLKTQITVVTLAMIAIEYGAEPYEVLHLTNHKYPRPVSGKPGFTAGTCLRKDFGMLSEAYWNTDILVQSWRINESVPKFLVEAAKARW